jgi:hypothetical protein
VSGVSGLRWFVRSVVHADDADIFDRPDVAKREVVMTGLRPQAVAALTRT